MNHSEEAPKLPKLPFVVGDLLLIATAVIIALRSPAPIGPVPLLAITICMVFGAALLVVPYLANYARRHDAELARRQNQIAVLARSTAESAEQLGIAATGLHGINESSRQNLETIRQLPTQLQERLDRITQQLAASTLALQRATQEDLAQLEAAAGKISRFLAKLENAAEAKSDTAAALEKDLVAALDRATRQIDSFVATTLTQAARMIDRPEPAAPPVLVIPQPLEPTVTDTPLPSTFDAPAREVIASPATEAKPKLPAIKTRSKASPPPAMPTTATPSITPMATPAADSAMPPVLVAETPESPLPIKIAPTTPFAFSPPPVTPADSFIPVEPEASEVPVDEPPAPKQPRLRKTKSDDEGFDLGLTSDAPESTESSMTSDGFTRLIATAYIGIGNRLYLRGDGPGLSWEKGVALQFVSIGKWRWETPDATTPITAKLYKNDQVECLGLGSLKLEPGRQHEVNAGF